MEPANLKISDRIAWITMTDSDHFNCLSEAMCSALIKAIDEAYASAYKKLCGLSGEKREALIKKLIARECEGSEVVCPSAKDRGIVEKLLPSCGISGLTLGETDGTISDGFTLKGNNYYKNCSFEALLAEVRTVTEAEVTKKLFK